MLFGFSSSFQQFSSRIATLGGSLTSQGFEVNDYCRQLAVSEKELWMPSLSPGRTKCKGNNGAVLTFWDLELSPLTIHSISPSEYFTAFQTLFWGWRNGSKQGLFSLLSRISWTEWTQALVVSLGYKKFHRLGGLHSKYLFLTALEAGKSEIMVPAWLGSGEGPPSGLQTAVFLLCPQIAERKRWARSVSSNKGH